MSSGDCLRSSDRALAPTRVSHIGRERCSNQTVPLQRGVPCHVAAAIRGALWKQPLHDHWGLKPNCHCSSATCVASVVHEIPWAKSPLIARSSDSVFHWKCLNIGWKSTGFSMIFQLGQAFWAGFSEPQIFGLAFWARRRESAWFVRLRPQRPVSHCSHASGTVWKSRGVVKYFKKKVMQTIFLHHLQNLHHQITIIT